MRWFLETPSSTPFQFLLWWIIKLKAGWHPHTASQVWNTKDNSRSRDSLLSSEWHICLSPLGFLLLTQHLFPLFVSLRLCEDFLNPPLFPQSAQAAAWPEMKGACIAGPGAVSEPAEGQNVLPKCSCGHWPGPALASLNPKCMCQNRAGKHLTSPHTSTAELVCWNWEFYHIAIHFSSQMVPTLPQGAAGAHAKLCYLLKADVFKGKTSPAEKWCAMSLIVYQVLPRFCFYSALADAPSTKKVWKWMWKSSSLPSQHMPTAASFHDLTEQPKAPKREGQTLRAVIFTSCNPYTILGASSWLADICNIWCWQPCTVQQLSSHELGPAPFAGSWFQSTPSKAPPWDALPWLPSWKTVFAVWPKINSLF